MSPRLILLGAVGALAVVSAGLLARRRALQEELVALRAASDSAVEAAADARLAAEVDRIRLALEAARGEDAQRAPAHLALVLGEGLLTLERGDIVFRSATVQADVPRGIHAIERIEPRLIALAGGLRLTPATPSDTGAPAAGTIRVPRADFDAIRPNLQPGQMAYFF